jgi:serine/threonine protein kinase
MLTELSPGALIGGRYRLDALLGEGGMGAVWAATHTVTRQRVALKMLKSPSSGRQDHRRRFWREARAASTVQHPNDVRNHDLFELENEAQVMVMDHLTGQTLGQL